MWLIQGVIGAALGWIVAKLLEPVLDRIDGRRAAEDERDGPFPWRPWCLAHAIAGGIAGALGVAFGLGRLHSSGSVGIWMIFGLTVGLAQWIVLRREDPIGPLWVAASALGWSIWSLFQAVQAPGYFGLSAVGLVVGLLQWTVLRRARERAHFWPPANIVAWPIAGALGLSGSMVLMVAGVPFGVAWIGGWAAVGLLGSLILGWVLGRMPRPEAAPPAEPVGPIESVE